MYDSVILKGNESERSNAVFNSFDSIKRIKEHRYK